MNVAFIPVRGGSKSIPLKNIRPMAGRPLVYWTVRAACCCSGIQRVYVATDSAAIGDAVAAFAGEDEAFAKVCVIGRSAESASDTASTESAMLEFAQAHEFDNIVLIQATSPLLEAADLEAGLALFARDGVDSVLSVVPQRRFIWSVGVGGLATPANYNVYARPRRQEFDAYHVENGAFYITSREALLATGNRVSGRIYAQPMGEDTFLEIDEPGDWPVIESLLERRLVREASADVAVGCASVPPRIRLLLTDCDGCLTDGGMYYGEDGSELKRFNTRDGMAFELLRKAGIRTGIITGEDSAAVRRRAEKLKADHLELGCADKAAAVRTLCEREGISPAEVAYMGDDLNDLECMRMVADAGGFVACPADAVVEVRAASCVVLGARGGLGAVRELAEMVLGKLWSAEGQRGHGVPFPS